MFGLLIVFLTQYVTYCVMGLLKISTNVTTNSVLPFLALGLGVDDMFLILRSFQAEVIKMRKEREGVDGEKKAEARFLAGETCLSLAIGDAGRSMTMTSFSNFVAFLLASTIPVLAVSTFCKACVIVITLNYFYLIFMFAPILGWFEKFVMKKQEGGKSGLGGAFARFFKNLFAFGSKTRDVLHSSKGKFGVVLAKALVLLLAIYGTTLLEFGISISDVAQEGTPAFKFADVYGAYFSFFPAYLATGNLFADFAGRQKELMDLVTEIKDCEYTYQVNGWYLPTMIDFINNTANNAPFNLTEDGVLKEEEYIEAMEWWMENDILGKEIVPAPRLNHKWEEGVRRQVMGDINIYMSELKGPKDFNKMFEYVEKVFAKSGTTLNIDDPTYGELSLFGTGIPFTYFEQYMIIGDYGLRLGLYAIGSILIVVTIFSQSLTVGVVTTLVVGSTIVELIGLLGVTGIKISALPMVTILSCIGIIVEFVGHIANR